MASPDWSPMAALETRRFIDNYVLPHRGPRKVRDLTTPAIDSYYAALRDHGGKDGRPLSDRLATARGHESKVRHGGGTEPEPEPLLNGRVS
jgi:hypothetical protein